MCIRIPSPKSAAPPPITPTPNLDTSLPDTKTIMADEAAKTVEYGEKRESVNETGKKTGTDQLKIPLNTGTGVGSTTGGANV